MNIYEKLTELQNELKAPKNQFNSFGKYKYRSCEDILEAVKPLLQKHKLAQVIDDDIKEINGRFYIKATITLFNNEKPEEVIIVSALAREEDSKKGMDSSQLTGSTSSYARKYALAGLYALDDTQDSDSLNTHGKEEKNTKDNQSSNGKLSEKQLQTLKGIAEKDKQKLVVLFKSAGIEMKALEELTKQEATAIIGKLYNK